MKILISVLAAVVCSACSAPARETSTETEEQVVRQSLRAEADVSLEERVRKDLKLGDCGVPDLIGGAWLFRHDTDSIVYLGWISECTDNFVFLPVVQKDFPEWEIYHGSNAPKHLDCDRISDSIASIKGLTARYSCDSDRFAGIRYYDIPLTVPTEPYSDDVSVPDDVVEL